jgi:hypothetical protein
MKFLNAFAVIIVLLVLGFFAMVVVNINSVSQTAHDVMLMLIGTLSGVLMTVIGYYFGSSKSSSEKNEVIQRVLAESSARPKAPPMEGAGPPLT